eukprot:TRINITY_DN25911_c1_g1_i1.p1 TRINITY_DN25911_c1_g1~~TRINITY_DN25911_c1_g1_i1.p1  ORF type:complete len:188 (-),score=-11.66 TRINITY_DN25911_c1_g1_i1:56-619(-)
MMLQVLQIQLFFLKNCCECEQFLYGCLAQLFCLNVCIYFNCTEIYKSPIFGSACFGGTGHSVPRPKRTIYLRTLRSDQFVILQFMYILFSLKNFNLIVNLSNLTGTWVNESYRFCVFELDFVAPNFISNYRRLEFLELHNVPLLVWATLFSVYKIVPKILQRYIIQRELHQLNLLNHTFFLPKVHLK